MTEMQTDNLEGDPLSRVIEAINKGELRLEAVRGDVAFNKRELALLSEAGVTAAEELADAIKIQGG